MKITTDNEPKISILVSDGLWNELLKIDSEYSPIKNLIQKYGMRVSHSSMTYRQINHLDNSGLLGAGREDNERKWRAFRFRDIAYLNIVVELKKFGIKNNNLKALHRLFYKNEKSMDYIILACLAGVEMTLILESDGSGNIFSPEYLGMYDLDGLFRNEQNYAEIKIRLNDIINKTLRDGGLSSRKIEYSASRFVKTGINNHSEAESIILESLKNSNYEEIRIKKKNGKPNVLYLSEKRLSDISPEDLLSSVAQQEFADIRIKYRNGKAVHYQQEKTVKL